MVRIVHRQQFCEQTFPWEGHAPAVLQAAPPRHLVMLRPVESSVRRARGERLPA